MFLQFVSENVEFKPKMTTMEEILQRSMEFGQHMYGIQDSQHVHIGAPAVPPRDGLHFLFSFQL